MTRSRLSALILTICFTGLVNGERFPKLSVRQRPHITAKEGANVSITCYIEADSQVEKIAVKWLLDNQTIAKEEMFNTSTYRSPSGSVLINTTLNLLSVKSNHSYVYYCKAHGNLPLLVPDEYGNGTHVYVVPDLTTTMTTPAPDPANPFRHTVMWSLLSALGFALLVICLTCLIHIHFKGHSKTKHAATDALIAASSGSPCFDANEDVVYAALNIPQDSVKSRNEICAAPDLSSVSYTEDSVTYSEVHIK
ncbi:uncharacterized protein si:dkey-63d15.12 [Danio aesculapii]|uniref:uncharacterized protein si:dkey-63d15.12 n=1 Tax=Danio aesculapii TaxID=1142201 RepID=UPI0024C02F7A|nr:uncharacterized protein si:dkey-63d15.12 [Danio aesculapii]